LAPLSFLCAIFLAMGKADEASDVESVSVKAKRKTSSKPSKKTRDSTTPEEVDENENENENQDDDDDEEDDDEEYEIEAILGSKKGIFPEVRCPCFEICTHYDVCSYSPALLLRVELGTSSAGRDMVPSTMVG
jgi:hypothetical protein